MLLHIIQLTEGHSSSFMGQGEEKKHVRISWSFFFFFYFAQLPPPPPQFSFFFKPLNYPLASSESICYQIRRQASLIHCYSALGLIYMQNVKQMPYVIHIYSEPCSHKIYYSFFHGGVNEPHRDDLYFLSTANAKLIKRGCDY